MAHFVGSWIQGDDGKYLRLSIRTQSNVGWGVEVGTGWTCKLEVRKPGATSLFATLTGSWEDATEVAALFGIGASGVLDPTTEDSLDWEAVLLLEKGGQEVRVGADDDRYPFGFTVTRWP